MCGGITGTRRPDTGWVRGGRRWACGERGGEAACCARRGGDISFFSDGGVLFSFLQFCKGINTRHRRTSA